MTGATPILRVFGETKTLPYRAACMMPLPEIALPAKAAAIFFRSTSGNENRGPVLSGVLSEAETPRDPILRLQLNPAIYQPLARHLGTLGPVCTTRQEGTAEATTRLCRKRRWHRPPLNEVT